jgi:hypothetical protein
MGQLEYKQATRSIATNLRVRLDRYMGEKEQAHLLSVFGADTEIGAIAAAIAENARFTVLLPDGSSQAVCLGEHASCYRGALPLAGRKQPVRHLVAVSQDIQSNGAAGKIYLLNFYRDLAWNTLVSVLGLPAMPEWGEWILSLLKQKKRIVEIDGIGCVPVRINVTGTQLLEWLGKGVRNSSLPFPEKTGPITWPNFSMPAALALVTPDATRAVANSCSEK